MNDETDQAGMDEGDPGPRTPENDPFRPPTENCEGFCLHCRQKYDSYKIHWAAGKGGQGVWWCGRGGWGGRGCGFDFCRTDEPSPERAPGGGFVGGWFNGGGTGGAPPVDD